MASSTPGAREVAPRVLPPAPQILHAELALCGRAPPDALDRWFRSAAPLVCPYPYVRVGVRLLYGRTLDRSVGPCCRRSRLREQQLGARAVRHRRFSTAQRVQPCAEG